VIASLTGRGLIKKDENCLLSGALVMGAGVMVAIIMFRELSGGFSNPAVTFAKIIWQEFSLNMDLDADNSPWSYTYATSFIIGPFCGSVLAGVFYNILDFQGARINYNEDLLDKNRLNDS